MKVLLLWLLLVLVASGQTVQAAEYYFWPVDGFYNISSGFGMRISGIHKGIDITGRQAGEIAGADVQATRSGTVSALYTACSHNYPKSQSCGCGGGYGNFVFITHPDGTVARYAHLENVAVIYGQSVWQGQVIGNVGSTGSSGGYHLHFELRSVEGEAQNTMPVNTGERHTYYGSSVSVSEAIAYMYKNETEVEVVEGKIRVQLPDLPGGQILIAQYNGTRLVDFLAAEKDTMVVAVPVSEEADRAKVMVWKDVFPVQAAVFLRF